MITGKLLCPAVNVNDAVTKSKFDNYLWFKRVHLIEGFQRVQNIQIAGKKCIGLWIWRRLEKDVLRLWKVLGAHACICEIDPIMAMQAHMEGYEVYDRHTANKLGDIFITATGCIKTIDQKDLR